MVDVYFDSHFRKQFGKLKEPIKSKVHKLILKIAHNPKIGKPMRYTRKASREVYLPPFRLSYVIMANGVVMMELYHKDNQ